jgi:hypothetical protein
MTTCKIEMWNRVLWILFTRKALAKTSMPVICNALTSDKQNRSIRKISHAKPSEFMICSSITLKCDVPNLTVGLRIKGQLTPSISPGFYSRTGRGGPPTWYQSRGPGFNSTQPHIFTALISPSLARSPYGGALLSMHMTCAIATRTQ